MFQCKSFTGKKTREPLHQFILGLTQRLLGLTVLFFLCFSVQGHAAEQKPVPREKAQASFIYNIFLNLQWPEESQIDQFKIGLYGKNLFLLQELNLIFSNKKVRGKKVVVNPISDISHAYALQALVVSPDHNRHLESIATTLRQSSTLLITEDAEDKRNVMINFFSPVPSKLGFEVNRSGILYEGITPSKDILLFGGTQLDIAVIHKQTEAELAKAIRAVEKQRKTISLQNRNINEKEADLFRLKSDLLQIKEALSENEGMLSEKKSVLAKKEADINIYSTQIRGNIGKLNSQRREIQEMEKLIAEKNTVLSQQIDTIKNQRFILVAAVTALVTFFSLIVVIFIGSQEKQKVNKMLENKTHELECANEMLLQMSEAKTQFLSTMSHEIRTPLNGVLGMVELLQDTPVNEQQRHYLNTVYKSGEMLLSVINDVLDYSKIEAGKMQIESVEFGLEDVIFDCTPIFAQRVSTDLTFIADIPTGTPLHLMGDPTRIRQIVLNLLSNAFKFTSVGEICLLVQSTFSASSQPYYTITVSDTGVGLSEQQCDKIFKAFAQADSSTTRRFGGTGLGLVISLRLAELMGGSISVKSELGQGASFTLTLPQILSNKSGDSDNLSLIQGDLIILDSHLLRRKVLADHAKAWGMNVVATDTLASVWPVLKLMRAKTPTIIIVAQRVESKDGLSLAAEIMKKSNNVKVVLQHNVGASFCGEQLERMHIAAVLEMPVAPSRLREVLTAQLVDKPQTKPISPVDVDSQEKSFCGIRVLVAEDNTVNQMVVKGMLAKMGIVPEVVNNGQEAVNIYRDKCRADRNTPPYDIILMDCEMPELDGLDATRQIRALEYSEGRSRVAIVALTAHAMAAQRKKTLDAGMDDHLVKPLNSAELHKILLKIPLRLAAEQTASA